MSRLAATFERLSAQGAKALVTYVTVGDPDAERSYQVIDALCRGGSDILELGVPFSDPTADGPVIQRAAMRALTAGTTVASVLAMVRRIRQSHDQPIVLFGYYNPFLQYGLERLATDARDAGADAFLVVDLPPEEAGDLHAASHAAGLDMIYLLTPTSDDSRIAAVSAVASGFVYYVSRTGVTGAAIAGLAEVSDQVARVKAAIPLPVCVGFGISTPEQAARLRDQADGVVVGSALVTMVEALGRGEETLAGIERATRALKAPLGAVLPRAAGAS